MFCLWPVLCFCCCLFYVCVSSAGYPCSTETPSAYSNYLGAFKEEPLNEFLLNPGLDNPATCPMCRFSISAIEIESPIATNLSLTRMCQLCKTEPVPESKSDNITLRAPKHKGTNFTKVSSWPAVAKPSEV